MSVSRAGDCGIRVPEQVALAPDYYPIFKCKGPACRNSCCAGWVISITFKEYCRLLGMPCSKDLRKLLDRSFILAERPSAERYALINAQPDGDCPLHNRDGYCRLQKDKGESALPSACRLFPRVIRKGLRPECACANSCEAVVKLMADREGPLSFVPVPQPAHEGIAAGDLTDGEQEVRIRCLDIIRDRAFPLPERLVRLGILAGTLSNSAFGAAESGRKDKESALMVQALLASRLLADSLHMEKYREEALDTLNARPATPEGLSTALYERSAAGFEAACPQWETLFESLLANHMFVTRFPYPYGKPDVPGAYTSLCAAYALLRFLCAGCLHSSGTSRLIDLAASLFRVVEHSGFAQNSAALLRAEGCVGPLLAALVRM